MAPKLNGNSTETVLRATVAAVTFAAGMGLLGLIIDLIISLRNRRVARARECLRNSAEDRPSYRWAVFGLTAASYLLLIPGLGVTILSCRVNLFGWVDVYNRTETMFGVIGHLVDDDLWLGAVLLTLFCMVIPAVKVLLLIFGECWRSSSKPRLVRLSRRCVLTVKFLSKWACPDLFAYILMQQLFRDCNHPNKLQSAMRLDIGFVCFAVFCMGSTLASLGLHVPLLPAVAAPETKRPCAFLRRLAAAAAAIFSLSSFALLCISLCMPSMELRLDVDLLMKGLPSNRIVEGIVRGSGIVDLLHTEVSIAQCVRHTAQWAREGEAANILACIMIAVFVVAFTAIDTLALLLMSIRGVCSKDGAGCGTTGTAAAVVRVLHKLSMLDVLIIGVVTICMAGKDLRESGVILSLREGIAVLFAVEVCRYAANALVSVASGGPHSPTGRLMRHCDSSGNTLSAKLLDAEIGGASQAEFSSSRADVDVDTKFSVGVRGGA